MTGRLSALYLLLLAACASPKAPPQSADNGTARIDRVLAGLRPGLAITGEPVVRWTLAERMKHYNVPGVSIAVIDSGRIVWAKGFGVKEAGSTDSVNTETRFQAGSISKPTFALGVMRLVQEGKLNLDEDVNAKLTSWKVPDNKFTAKEKVTLRRILSHNAGLTVHGFPGYEAGTPVPTVPQVLNGEKPANTAPVRADTFPGAITRYSGGGTTIAMLLVTDVTKKPFPDFMKETVLGPAGMTHSTYEQPLPAAMAPNTASGHSNKGEVVKGKYHTYPEMSAAGLWTTPSDLATLAIELQHTYAGQSDKVVNQATLKQMFTVQASKDSSGFGIGYFINGSGPNLEFAHNGADEGFLADFVGFAERGQGAFVMTNGDNGGQLMGEIVAAVAAEYGWPSHLPQQKTLIAKDAKALADLTGGYGLQLGGPKPVPASVALENGKLFFEAKDGPFSKDELLADSDTTFFLRESGYPVTFGRDKNGKVIGINVAGVAGKRMK
ncbi:MAG: serine hydrolase [Gemmatimonadota bacterium]